jgi:hypothetical protein
VLAAQFEFKTFHEVFIMTVIAPTIVLAAVGYSLLYLLLGGGLGGAILIFIVAKMLGR